MTSTSGVGTQDLIEKAREVGVLEPPLVAKLQDMVALKDAILRGFWRLGYQQVYNAVWRELGVLDEFACQIKRPP